MGEIISKYTKKELNEIIDDLLEYGEGSTIDELSGLAAMSGTREELMSDFIKTMGSWFMYQRNAILEEDYETAMKLKQVIDMEKDHYLNIIQQFCPWFNSKSDKALIKDIMIEFREIYQV